MLDKTIPYQTKIRKNYRLACKGEITCKDCIESYKDYKIFERNNGVLHSSILFCNDGHICKKDFTCDKAKAVK